MGADDIKHMRYSSAKPDVQSLLSQTVFLIMLRYPTSTAACFCGRFRESQVISALAPEKICGIQGLSAGETNLVQHYIKLLQHF